jgi:hypothetical protein
MGKIPCFTMGKNETPPYLIKLCSDGLKKIDQISLDITLGINGGGCHIRWSDFN